MCCFILCSSCYNWMWNICLELSTPSHSSNFSIFKWDLSLMNALHMFFYGSSALAWLSQVPQLTLTRRGLAKNQISCRTSQWKYFLLFRSTTFVIRISGLGWHILQVDNGSKRSWIQQIGGAADIPPSTEHTLPVTETNYYELQFLLHVCALRCGKFSKSFKTNLQLVII